MVKFPIKFEVRCEANSKMESSWKSSVNGLDPIKSALPVEFHGPGGAYTPEDFFALAVLNCIISMFKVKCSRSKITFSSLKGKACLYLDQDPETTRLLLKELDLVLEIGETNNPQKAKELLEYSINNCPVSSAIKTPKTYKITIV